MRSLTLQLSNLAHWHLWKCSTRHRTKMFLREQSRHNGVGPVRERFLMMIPAGLVSIELIKRAPRLRKEIELKICPPAKDIVCGDSAGIVSVRNSHDKRRIRRHGTNHF